MPLILQSPARVKFLRKINDLLLAYKENEEFGVLIEAVSEMVKQEDFAKALAANPAFKGGFETETDLKKVAWAFLYHHLGMRDYVSAALILWGPDTFTPEPRFVQLIWEGLFNHSKINVMGCASGGKTFSSSAWALLDWLLDPEWTRVEVASNSEKHVKMNLYAGLVQLHSCAALELPGQLDANSLSLNKKTGHGIFVLVIPGGPRARGKARGAKRKTRPHHPLFGNKSRIRFIFDEAQEIAPNIFDDIANMTASMNGAGHEHVKIFMAANPKDEFSRYGQNCKPVGGWEKIDDDTETWRSTTGWHTIRLNAMKSENVISGREIYKGLITREGVQGLIESAGGNDQDPIVYSQVYAKFSPQGLMSTIIKPEHIRRAEGEWIFSGSTTALFSNDPAFTGDSPAIASGRVGLAVGWMDYDGNRHDLKEPAVKIQVDVTGSLVRGDTQDMADENLSRCAALRVEPYGFAIDRTGVGQGVFDICCRQWEQKVGPLPHGEKTAGIIGVHFAEAASETKIADEDTKTPKDLYDNVATELWLAAGKLFEYDVIRLGKGVEKMTFEELAGRRGGMKVGIGRKLSIESKKTYKARTGRLSPDRADTVTLLIFAARQCTTGLIPRAKDTKSEAPPPRDPWGNFTLTQEAMPMRGYQGHTVLEGMQD